MATPRLIDIQGEYNSKAFSLKLSRHPSEGDQFFLARVLAYLMFEKDGVKFYAEVCEGDDPVLVIEEAGQINYWIEIGVPSLKKMKHARARSKRIVIIAYKDLESLKELRQQVNDWNNVRMLYIKPPLLKDAAKLLKPKTKFNIEWDGEWLHIDELEGKILEF